MEVIPVLPLDRLIFFRNIRTRTFFIVDDQLNCHALRESLARLIRDHWRKLGARIANSQDKDGQLVYRLPEVFPDDYELFKWSENHNPGSADKIPEVASLLKTASSEGVATLLPSLDDFDSVFRPSGWPFHLQDAPDAPMLLVHLSTFADATVITISHPHVLGDQMGLMNIVKVWLGMLEGNPPPPMIGYLEDALPGKKPFDEYPSSEVVKKGRMRIKSRLENVGTGLGFIPELVLNPREDKRMLFLPASLVRLLRDRQFKKLAGDNNGLPELTNADIITAIMTKLSRLNTGNHMLSLSQTVNLRGRIPQLSSDDQRAGYVHNGLVYATSRFPFQQSLTLGDIALMNRQAILRTLDPKLIDTLMAVAREVTRRSQKMHICEPFEKSYHVSNWSPAWRELDFSKALDAGAKEARGDKRLRLLVLGQGKESKFPYRFSATIMCKTDEGYWVDWAASRKTMKAVKMYLAKDPMLEEL